MFDAIKIQPPASVHLIGICGTGMGALAGLLQEAGYRVRGSDAQCQPPMRDVLSAAGIEVVVGYAPENVAYRPDLVVVGNVCRSDHPEVRAAAAAGIPLASMPQVVAELFLPDRRPLVVAGTHGKTTTSSLLAYLLDKAGCAPGFLVGGQTVDFGRGYRLGTPPYFVLEGDEYDSAFFHKRPKFSFYRPDAAIVTSVEYDHADIYGDENAYRAVFESFVASVRSGPLVVYSGDPGVQYLLRTGDVRCPVITYAVIDDPVAHEPAWVAKPRRDGSFELIVEGRSRGVFSQALHGRHNLRNTLAAFAVAHTVAGIPLEDLSAYAADFRGVARRQQLVGEAGGVLVYDDFAHHPTAVSETLFAIRSRHPKARRMVAVYEPKSATACRSVHQSAYGAAFSAADAVVLAPVARDIPAEERLDTAALCVALGSAGKAAWATTSWDDVAELVVNYCREGDVVVCMSNGSMGGFPKDLVTQLAQHR